MTLGELAPVSSRPFGIVPAHSAADDLRFQAHDLKNKLQVVLGFCDLLLAPSGVLEDRQRASRMIGNIRAAAQDSARIASAIVSPVTAVALAAVDLNALLLEEVGLLCQDLLRQDINVHVERNHNLPPVCVDRVWLARTILNLAHNARDAIVGQAGRCTSGLIRFSTSLPSVAMQRPFVILTVCDNGPGMDEPTLERIWDAGWSTKCVAEGGHGYGLASVRAFAHEIGGWIDVDSRPGQGTEFSLCLPAASPRG